MTTRIRKNADFDRFLLINQSINRINRKIQLLQIGSRPWAFPPAIDEVHKLTLSPPKVGLKSEFAVFVHTIQPMP